MRKALLSAAAALALATPAFAADGSGGDVDAVLLSGLEVRLFDKESGVLTDDVLDENKSFSGWNMIIGEGGAPAAEDILILAPVVSLNGGVFSETPLRIEVRDADGALVASRDFGASLTGADGRDYKVLWLNDAACMGELTVSATMGLARQEATLNLMCGE